MENELLNLDNFLKSKGFFIVERKKSPYFGDFTQIYSDNRTVDIRVSKSKGDYLFDVKNHSATTNSHPWFDLGLLMLLKKGKSGKVLIEKINDKVLIDFILSDFSYIIQAFSDKDHFSIEQSLIKLGNERFNCLISKD